MNIVLLESLGIEADVLASYAEKPQAQGHTFTSYARNDEVQAQIRAAEKADILMIANMPLR